MAHLCATLHKVHAADRKMQRQEQEHPQTHDINDTHGASSSRLRLISSSGGNAGLAVITVAASMPDVDVSVVVPLTTKPLVIAKLRSLGAEVTVHGANWNDADSFARRRVDESDNDEAAVYVSPYDNPLLWTGHSTVIDEIIDQLLDSSVSSSS